MQFQVTGDGFFDGRELHRKGSVLNVDDDFDLMPSRYWIPLDEKAKALCEKYMSEFLPPLQRGKRDDEDTKLQRELQHIARRNWTREAGDDDQLDEETVLDNPSEERGGHVRTMREHAEELASQGAMGHSAGVVGKPDAAAPKIRGAGAPTPRAAAPAAKIRAAGGRGRAADKKV